MCTYNGAQFLQKQLDTFASQTYPPYELIVCDDGSTDATLALTESFARKVPFPVRIFKNERNLGSTRNFEKAIGICDGDLVALSDQDDEWYPDKLARMHRLFEELPEALAAFSNADIIDDDSALRFFFFFGATRARIASAFGPVMYFSARYACIDMVTLLREIAKKTLRQVER